MKIKLFPTNHIDLESRWWTRLIKILIISFTVFFAIAYYTFVIYPDMQRQPYYVFSFDPKFGSYSEPIINCNVVLGNCWGGQNGNASDLVQSYAFSTPQRNTEILNMMDVSSDMTYAQLLPTLINNGEITTNLQAKDINDVNGYLERDWFVLVVYTVLFFLFMTQVILRLIFYTIYGKK